MGISHLTHRTHPTYLRHRTHLADFPALFAALPAPEALVGTFRAEFTGPWWLRTVAGPGLWPLGLGGWWGKQFAADGSGMNLVRRGGRLQAIFPVHLIYTHSLLDGQSCLAVRYLPECPFPWPYVVDELRWLDTATLLGMTLVDAGPLRRLPLPFLLHRS